MASELQGFLLPINAHRLLRDLTPPAWTLDCNLKAKLLHSLSQSQQTPMKGGDSFHKGLSLKPPGVRFPAFSTEEVTQRGFIVTPRPGLALCSPLLSFSCVINLIPVARARLLLCCTHTVYGFLAGGSALHAKKGTGVGIDSCLQFSLQTEPTHWD